ncbi:MAG: hypothetical protein KKF89_00440 [Nanoarchaeota archaeon]|nr:hypothetical protein [Nanoarchaeota archaeon]MBU1854164.1 hypothetical protein [Nanoarchaeota archaeon]
MEHITIKNEDCIINLNNSFYPKKTILEGIERFDKKKNVKIKENGEIVIKKVKDKTIGLEFCDLLLSIMQEDKN